jgi:hypothetical protein
MPREADVESVSRVFSERLRTLRGLASSGRVSHSQLHEELVRLERLVRLMNMLAAKGLTELLLVELGEDVVVGRGWLPVRGADVYRLFEAFAEAGVHLYTRRDSWYCYTPHVYVYGREYYVETPLEAQLKGLRAFVRLADAEEEEKLTSGLSPFRDNRLDELLESEEYPYMDRVGYLTCIEPEQYLELAARVNGYASSVYARTGFPVQMLCPYLPASTRLVIASLNDSLVPAQPGRLLGELTPYDPEYGRLTAAGRPQERALRFDPEYLRLEPEARRSVAEFLRSLVRVIYRDGSGSFFYEFSVNEATRGELARVLGDSFWILEEFVSKHGEGLFLYIREPGGTPLLVEESPPPAELAPVLWLAEAYGFDSIIMRPAVEDLAGYGHLLSLMTDSIATGRGSLDLYLLTKPRPLTLVAGVYYDAEDGVGVAAPIPYVHIRG